MYRLVESGVIRLSDGASIPADERNSDYHAFLAWQAAGGVPIPLQPAPYYELVDSEWVADLAGAKAAKKQEIAAARWNEMSSPTTVSGYDAVWYTDKESLDDMNRASINLQRAIALGHKSENTMIEWKTANGTFINLSLNDLITVELLLSQRQQELYTKESLLKNQIEASSTVNEVELLHW